MVEEETLRRNRHWPHAVARFERVGGISKGRDGTLTGDRKAALKSMLETAGVEFTDGAQPGVRLRKATP
jgi:hypothetical protein